MPWQPKPFYKIIFCGPTCGGASSLLDVCIGRHFLPDRIPTIGVDFGTIKYQYREQNFKLQIWDLNGLPHYYSINDHYFLAASLVVLFVSHNEQNNTDFFNHYIKLAISRNIPVILVLPKIDLLSPLARKHRIETLMTLASQHVNIVVIIETSAKEKTNVVEFKDLLCECLKTVGIIETMLDGQLPIPLAPPRPTFLQRMGIQQIPAQSFAPTLPTPRENLPPLSEIFRKLIVVCAGVNGAVRETFARDALLINSTLTQSLGLSQNYLPQRLQIVHKILLCGQYSGKSTLLHTLTTDAAPPPYDIGTIGVSFAILKRQYQNYDIKFQIWDTSAPEKRGRDITLNYGRGASLLLFSAFRFKGTNDVDALLGCFQSYAPSHTLAVVDIPVILLVTCIEVLTPEIRKQRIEQLMTWVTKTTANIVAIIEVSSVAKQNIDALRDLLCECSMKSNANPLLLDPNIFPNLSVIYTGANGATVREEFDRHALAGGVPQTLQQLPGLVPRSRST